MIEYSFLRDHLSGGPLVILTLSLVVFAVHVPMLIGFTVARYAARRLVIRRPSPSRSLSGRARSGTDSGHPANAARSARADPSVPDSRTTTTAAGPAATGAAT